MRRRPPRCRRALGAVIDSRQVNPKGHGCVLFTVKTVQHGGRNADIQVYAMTGDGHTLGDLWASPNPGKRTLDVFSAHVESPGCGVGTRLYEAAAREACARDYKLKSDWNLSRYSKGFWEKQQRKGRAKVEINKDTGNEHFVLRKCVLTLEGRRRR